MSEVNVSKVVEASLWRIVIDPIEIKTHTDGGFELPRQTVEDQEYLRYVGQVVDIGPLAFNGDRFKDNYGVVHRPCDVGDWIIYGKHTGVDVFMTAEGGKIRRLRVINDDHVVARVHDIEQIKIPL